MLLFSYIYLFLCSWQPRMIEVINLQWYDLLCINYIKHLSPNAKSIHIPYHTGRGKRGQSLCFWGKRGRSPCSQEHSTRRRQDRSIGLQVQDFSNQVAEPNASSTVHFITNEETEECILGGFVGVMDTPFGCQVDGPRFDSPIRTKQSL